MMWFYKLKRSVRVIIAVVAWLPVFIFCGIIGGDIGENAGIFKRGKRLYFCFCLPSAWCLRSLPRLPASVKSNRSGTRNPPPRPNGKKIRRPPPMYGDLQLL